VQVLDCPAAYDSCDIEPSLPAVVVSPLRGETVLGRIRRYAEEYQLTNRRVTVPVYRMAKEDNQI